MSDKIIIVDFEDSFTYNIASVLFPLENELKVIPHQIFFKSNYEEILIRNEKCAVILGPGPGHPSEFYSYFELIKNLMAKKSIYVMGICLGHQILGLIENKIIKEAEIKVHGQTEEILFKNQKYNVQRYNSLAVYENDKEVNLSVFERGVSYQFHPESIGTEKNIVFFQDLLDFIKQD
jgi:anthranilate synthase component 2